MRHQPRSRTRSISYTPSGTTRRPGSSATAAPAGHAVEHLRLVMAEVQVATVRNEVALSLFTDFENYTTFKPASYHEKSVSQMLDQLVAWGGAMKILRSFDARGA